MSDARRTNEQFFFNCLLTILSSCQSYRRQVKQIYTADVRPAPLTSRNRPIGPLSQQTKQEVQEVLVLNFRVPRCAGIAIELRAV